MKSVFAKLNLPAIPAAIDNANNHAVLNIQPTERSQANDERSQSYRNELKNLLIDKQQQVQELKRRASIDKLTINSVTERIEEDEEFKDTEINIPIPAPKLELLTRKTTPPIEEIKPIQPIEPKKRLPRGRRPLLKTAIVPK
jgi:hypothetical protein